MVSFSPWFLPTVSQAFAWFLINILRFHKFGSTGFSLLDGGGGLVQLRAQRALAEALLPATPLRLDGMHLCFSPFSLRVLEDAALLDVTRSASR